MRIVVTGADGFIGQNLRVRLAELGHTDVACVTRAPNGDDLRAALACSDFIFHLAGVNRPTDVAEFARGNRDVTAALCVVLQDLGRAVPIAYASSTQAALDTQYGESKLAAEQALTEYADATGAPV